MRLQFKSLFLSLLLGSSAFVACADDDTSKNYTAFVKAFKKGDMGKVEKLLDKWAKETPNDPELYCSWAQFYYFQAVNQIEQSEDIADFEHTAMFPDTIAMFQDLKVQNYRILKDKGNGLEYFNKAVVWQQRCMDEYPDLLSMYDNYMDVLNAKKEYKYSTKVAFQLIDRALANGGNWVDYNLKPYDEQLRQELDGELVRLFTKQIEALLEGAEYELTDRLIERLEKAFPDNLNYIYINAQIQDALGNREKALAAAAKLKTFTQIEEAVQYGISLEQKYATSTEEKVEDLPMPGPK